MSNQADWEQYIEVNPEILVGKPVVRGTRLAVEFILDLIAAGWSVDRLLEEYPRLTIEGVRACAAYAAELVREQKVYPIKAA